MCWVALDRGARLAARRGERGPRRPVAAGRQRDPRRVCERGVDERGVFTQYYDTDALDASSLLIPLVRFLPHGDDARARRPSSRSPTS